jgi:hypothetical protein
MNEDIFDIMTYAWLFGFIGFALGMYVQKKALYNILRIKSIDGTGEHIGNGQFVYIMSDEDYCRIVLQIERD